MNIAPENLPALIQPVKKKRLFTPEQKARKAEYDQKFYLRPEIKERRRLDRKIWFIKNKSKRMASIKVWINKNKDRQKLYEKKYISKNRTKTNARHRRYRAKNPHLISEYNSKFRNKIKIENPDYFRKYGDRRRARKLSNSTEEQIRLAEIKIKNLFSHKFAECAYCAKRFKTNKMHIEHIVPFARGGSHSPENICLACRHCNYTKHDKILGTEWIPPQLSLLNH
jgi:5-methylcytosine-specific restriction endonuclease McrA